MEELNAIQTTKKITKKTKNILKNKIILQLKVNQMYIMTLKLEI